MVAKFVVEVVGLMSINEVGKELKVGMIGGVGVREMVVGIGKMVVGGMVAGAGEMEMIVGKMVEMIVGTMVVLVVEVIGDGIPQV